MAGLPLFPRPMAARQGAGRAAVVLRAGHFLAHVHDIGAIDAVVQALATHSTTARPPSAGADGLEGSKQTARDLVRDAAEEATRYLCSVSRHHANGLHQAVAQWRDRLPRQLLRDLRELHTAAVVCRHATSARFAQLLEDLKEVVPADSTRLQRTEASPRLTDCAVECTSDAATSLGQTPEPSEGSDSALAALTADALQSDGSAQRNIINVGTERHPDAMQHSGWPPRQNAVNALDRDSVEEAESWPQKSLTASTPTPRKNGRMGPRRQCHGPTAVTNETRGLQPTMHDTSYQAVATTRGGALAVDVATNQDPVAQRPRPEARSTGIQAIVARRASRFTQTVTTAEPTTAWATAGGSSASSSTAGHLAADAAASTSPAGAPCAASCTSASATVDKAAFAGGQRTCFYLGEHMGHALIQSEGATAHDVPGKALLPSGVNAAIFESDGPAVAFLPEGPGSAAVANTMDALAHDIGDSGQAPFNTGNLTERIPDHLQSKLRELIFSPSHDSDALRRQVAVLLAAGQLDSGREDLPNAPGKGDNGKLSLNQEFVMQPLSFEVLGTAGAIKSIDLGAAGSGTRGKKFPDQQGAHPPHMAKARQRAPTACIMPGAGCLTRKASEAHAS